MPVALKDQNKVPLLAVGLANLALFVLLIHGDAIGLGGWKGAAEALRDAFPAGVAMILLGIVNAQLSSDVKARIIFLKWRDALPGSESFGRHGRNDARVDFAALERHFGPLPSSPREQNALWYKLFKSIDDDVSVKQVHREFLFTRDYGCMSLMMAIALGPIALATLPSLKLALAYWGLLIAQLFLVVRAARQHGYRLVTTVLALKSAGR
jgi:hypothetical protein